MSKMSYAEVVKIPSKDNSEEEIPQKKLTYEEVAKISFVNNGGDIPFLYAVYKNGTIIAWKSDDDMEISEEEIKNKADQVFDKFPGFIAGSPLGDFSVSQGKEKWFQERAKNVAFVTYDSSFGFMSCMLGPFESDLKTGLSARENVMKDAKDRECIAVGKNKK